jgi:hypothetical protein
MYFGELSEKGLDYQRGHDLGGKRMADFLIKEIQKTTADGSMVRGSDVVSFLKKKAVEWQRHCKEFGMG